MIPVKVEDLFLNQYKQTDGTDCPFTHWSGALLLR